jgi:hypothetical protein
MEVNGQMMTINNSKSFFFNMAMADGSKFKGHLLQLVVDWDKNLLDK